MNNKQAAGLRDVGLVPWHDITDSSGSAAAIPFLLAAIASGDPAAARTALDGLRNRICRYGFVVGQATAVTVPFLAGRGRDAGRMMGGAQSIARGRHVVLFS